MSRIKPLLGCTICTAVLLVLGSFAVAQDIYWVPDADGSWNDAVNWSSNPSLPGNSDDVTIDVGGENIRTITSGGATVRDLICQENISASGGFTIYGVAGINGEFSLTNGSLSLTQPSSSFTALNTTNLYNTNITINNGAIASFDLLTNYSVSTASNIVVNQGLRVSDPGSQLNLSSLTHFSGGYGYYYGANYGIASVSNGGFVDLSGVTTAQNRIYFQANGAGSILDLSALDTFTSAPYTYEYINTPGSINANNGGVIYLDNLSRAEMVSFTALNGSSLNMPSMTTFYSPYMCTTIKADGAGSVIDMSAVTNFTGGIGTETYHTHRTENWNYQTIITANNGGLVDLSGESAIASQVCIVANGADSLVDLSGLTSLRMSTVYANLTRGNDYFYIYAANGGTVRLGTGDMDFAANAQPGIAIDLHAGTGTVEVGTLNLLNGTYLRAAGTIDGNLTSSGMISVDIPQLLTVTGDYTMNSTSKLYIGIGGQERAVDYDAVDVSGIASLDGHLGVSLTGGFVPTPGYHFDLISAGTISGDFATMTLPTLPAALEWRVSRSIDRYTLVVVPKSNIIKFNTRLEGTWHLRNLSTQKPGLADNFNYEAGIYEMYPESFFTGTLVDHNNISSNENGIAMLAENDTINLLLADGSIIVNEAINARRNLMIGNHQQSDSITLDMFVKKGDTYTLSELAGQWYLRNLHVSKNDGPDSFGYDSATMTIASNGSIDATFTDEAETTWQTTGTSTIDPNGIVTMTIDGWTNDPWSLTMNDSNDVMIGNCQDDESLFLNIFARQDAAVDADMAGVWYSRNLCAFADSDPNNFNYENATLTIQNDGSFLLTQTNTTKQDAGGVLTFSTGTAWVDATGKVTLDFDDDTPDRLPVLGAGKDVMVNNYTDSDNAVILEIFVKKESLSGDLDFDGIVNLKDFAIFAEHYLEGSQ